MELKEWKCKEWEIQLDAIQQETEETTKKL